MKSIFGVIFCAFAAFGQVSFEVASIRPSAPPGDARVNVGVHIDGARVSCTSLSLKEYIGMAYEVKGYQILGPEWLASARFDITATLPAGSAREQVRDMIKALLAERFGLKLHPESKEFPVYGIVRGKGPVKLKETPPDAEADASEAEKGATNITGAGGRGGVNINFGKGSWFSFANNRLEGKKLTMTSLAETLARFEDRPVVDMTELKGNYDFMLEFSPEDYQAMLIRAAVIAGVVLPPQALQAMEAASGDSLRNSMQALGLKLEPTKAPLQVLAVDHMERAPSEN